MRENIKGIIIKDYIKISKITNKQFCEQCGINIQTLNKILKFNYCNRLETLEKMAITMRLPLWVLLTY